MIYFDNAATSWPKPPAVAAAMERFLREQGANPGRSGHRLSIEAGRVVYEARERVARIFGLDDPLAVVLTKNATEALNLALLGSLAPGDHVITSVMEHNSVLRPLRFLEERGVSVTRLGRSKGFSVEVAERPDGFHVALDRQGAPAVVADPVVVCSSGVPAPGPLVVFVPSDSLGRGPAELGERLMGAFFHSLLEVTPKPRTVVFMNAGVKLAVEGSRALDDLCALEALGVEILACGTCLSYFELSDRLAVGKVSNMYEIATVLLEAGKVVDL